MWVLYILIPLILAVALLVLFLVFPGKRRDRAPFDRTLYAHRGLHDNSGACPENSLAAFCKAKEAGFGVELDVRFTADRQVVVFHDDDLKRMCGVDARVDELTYDELKQYRLLGGDQHIPLLTEVLDVLDGTALLCEFKAMRSYTDTSLCDATLPLLEGYKGAYCIESFNPFMVGWFRKNAPHVIRGILSKQYEKRDLNSPLLRGMLSSLLANFLCRPDFIAFQHCDKQSFFFRLCRALGAAAVAWTVRSAEEEEATVGCFDTLIFERYLPQK